ncbi:MAG: sortase [Lutibacter sp.]|jgi:LPXTG-site transpeptidase (sortase) family protein
MKEFLIFVLIFLVMASVSLIIFNGKYIYSQIKYSHVGTPSNSDNDFNTKTIINSIIKGEKELLLPEKIYIPQALVDAPIVISQSTEEESLQADLEKGVIYLPGSSALNENGTMVIMGHSSAYPWYKGEYGSVFALLNKLNIGDEFTVFSKNKSFIYRVESKEIKAPKDLIFEKNKNNAVLYLVSCWPINTAWKRIVIKTVQVLDKQQQI